MRAYRGVKRWLIGLGFIAGCGGPTATPVGTNAGSGQCRLTHASYTTIDDTLQGCDNGGPMPNGVNCNIYDGKDRVYLTGGPTAGGLPDGNYFFAVLVPGSQNGGFLDGADGNLSDTTAGATAGDTGAGDTVDNRTFSIAGGVISYAGTHAVGSRSGKPILGLAVFDDTSNPGGEYTLAICNVGATSPCDCKYDNFKVRGNTDEPPPPPPVVSGEKYYDANANGQLDPGEAGIAGWQIGFTDSFSGVIVTGADGTFAQTLVADTFTFAEVQATNTASLSSGKTIPLWIQTGNTVDQSNVAGALQPDKSYLLSVVDGQVVTGVYFGNVCLGKGGGLTLGFWSNKNGQALFNSADLAALVALNLRNASGANYDPPSYSSFRTWLLNATATNMAYMLSAQFATMTLNVRHGLVAPGALVYAPGAHGASSSGLIAVQALLDEANAELGAHGLVDSASPYRAYQEALKDALDFANNNLSFVQSSAAGCPAPTF